MRGGGRSAGVAAVAVVLALTANACASGSHDGGRARRDESTDGVRLEALARDGAGWAVPDPLPPGRPGEPIAVGAPTTSEVFDGASRVDLLYHSTSRTGDDVAVSGTLLVPPGDAPAGGWPVVSWAHGTSGVADACAPSTTPNLFYDEYGQQVRTFLDAGYAVAATDYPGLGTPGMHPYSVGVDLGNAVADIVAAARALDTDLSSTWFAVGHSEGGQAVLFASRAAVRHPDLTLAGTVAIAPSSNLRLALPGIAAGAVPADVAYGVYLLAGLSTVDRSVHVADLLGPAARAHLDVLLRSGCLLDALAALRDAPPGGLFAIPDAQMRRLSALLARVGDPDRAPTAGPLLIVQGEEDHDIPKPLTDAVVASLQEQGVDVTYRTYPSYDHDTVLGPTACETLAWMADHGGSAAAGCRPAPTDLS